MAYLAAEGGRFARTMAAFKEEASVGDGRGCDESNLVVSGAVLEKAWAFVHRGIDNNTEVVFDAITLGEVLNYFKLFMKTFTYYLCPPRHQLSKALTLISHFG